MSPTTSRATNHRPIAISSCSASLVRPDRPSERAFTIFSQSSAKPIPARRERGAEHGHARRVAVGEDQVRNADRGEDHEAAHRRRAGLHVVLGRALLADVLAELALAQELDELRARGRWRSAARRAPRSGSRPSDCCVRRRAPRRPARGPRRASPSRAPRRPARSAPGTSARRLVRVGALGARPRRGRRA